MEEVDGWVSSRAEKPLCLDSMAFTEFFDQVYFILICGRDGDFFEKTQSCWILPKYVSNLAVNSCVTDYLF